MAEEESRDLVCSKEVTMTAHTQPTSRYLSSQEERVCRRYSYRSEEGSKSIQHQSNTLQAKHMTSWFWPCHDVAEENTGTNTGEDHKGVVEDAEFEAVEVMCIKELLLFGLNCFSGI